MMQKISRELIYTIARHSNWSAESISNWFRKENIYASTTDWVRFIRLFVLVLGVGFIGAGVVFFFAYNWADMHKFVKLGILQALLVGVTIAVFFFRLSELVKNVLLSVATLLVGVLFAVFGQIYQTGANAYDFFLGWTCCVVLWVLFSRFQPLWLLFLALLNTTFMLYPQQVVTNLPFTVVLDVLFVLNATTVLVWEILFRKGIIRNGNRWFPRLFSLAAIVPITMGMIMSLFAEMRTDYGACYLLATVAYGAGIWFGLRSRDLFYLSVIPFSLIIVAAAVILRLAGNDFVGMYLLASLFVIGSVALLVHNLIQFNRRWHA